ncbi:hypothetical protein [Paracoccus versutus]|uniref:hypothetical protein n=1 Tax=Paracoccus versutus TaxID=34007 RepID=UPI000DF7E7BF|nr:hypothetical protein [Paracoccus versutus]RDD72889.1 hypothetical protein DVR11_02880 [Paracoccus versutus]
MLKFLNDEREDEPNLQAPLCLAIFIHDVSKKSDGGYNFKKSGDSIEILMTPDPDDLAAETFEIMRDWVKRMSCEIGMSMSVSLTDTYIGVCLSRRRPNHKKREKFAATLIDRCGRGDFDFRSVTDNGTMRRLTPDDMQIQINVLSMQIMIGLATGYNVKL